MSQPLRVISIGHSYVVAMNRAILREIAKDPDFEVTVVAPKRFHGSLRSIELENEPLDSKLKVLPINAYLTHKMHFFAYDPFQLKAILKQNYDCLHIWEEPYIFAGYQIARQAWQTQTPFCIRTAQSLIKTYPVPFRRFEKSVFTWCKKWIAGGRLVFEAMAKKGWNDEGKGTIITLAVDTERFKPFREQEKENIRQLLGFEKPVIGFLGRLTEEKGCAVFMQALSRLKHRSWSLFIMGSGPYEAKIKEWIAAEGLQGRVLLRLYSHDQIPQVLPVCDLLLCPSQTREFWQEQFGRMIVEAFAAGVPVVGSDSGEIPHIIGEAGVVVPESNIERWVTAIDTLLSDPILGQEYSKKGYAQCQQYSAKTIAEQYKIFYRELAAQSRED